MVDVTGDGGQAKGVSVLGLIAMAFFWVSGMYLWGWLVQVINTNTLMTAGGMYGCEPLVQLAPAAHVFITLIVTALVYLLPSAIISTDIAIGYPLDGGMVSWIDVAFEHYPIVGAQALYYCWLNNLIQSAIYPVLASYYITEAVGGAIPREVYCEMVVSVMLAMRMFDFNGLTRVSILLSAISVTPTVLFIGFAAEHMDPSTWTDTKGEYNCSKFSSNDSHIIPNDDDWAVSEGICRVPVNWGSLLSYCLWSVCTYLSTY